MGPISRLAVVAMIATSIGAAPLAADSGRGHGQNNHRGAQGHATAGCPPGLAKKYPSCVPPGQARKQAVRYGNRVGEILRVGDYVLIRDPYRYALDPGPDWSYYQDDDRIYRVDSTTRKVLAVLNLIDAFAN